MKIFIASGISVVLSIIGFGVLFGFGMGGGFNYLKPLHNPSIYNYFSVIQVFVLVTALLGSIVISWFLALRPDKKLTAKTILLVLGISAPIALALMKIAEG